MNANTPTKALRWLLISLLLFSLPVFAQAEGMAETDYAAAVRLNWNNDTRKQEATVLSFVDGDTTHFSVPESVLPGGVLKARYLAINTPECTGKIEEYGKAAAAFTREKLESAESIVLESDDENWNLDSTGGRYLVWVWYRPAGAAEYRNLNIELLQNGLAVASAASRNRYGEICVSAISQAKNQKRCIYSGQKDPDFYYGDAIELTIRELRMHPEEYQGKKVAFSGNIIMNYAGSVYVEQYDPETDAYFGMPVYYGYNLSGAGLDALSVGNETRIVGSFQYYEGGQCWQVSDVKYRMMKPDDPGNLKKISEGHAPAYPLLTAAELHGDRAQTALATSARLEGLKVISAETTRSEDAAKDGALTLHCRQNGEAFVIRTVPLRDAAGELVGESTFVGKTIDARGIVECYEGNCQLRVFSLDGISVQP